MSIGFKLKITIQYELIIFCDFTQGNQFFLNKIENQFFSNRTRSYGSVVKYQMAV